MGGGGTPRLIGRMSLTERLFDVLYIYILVFCTKMMIFGVPADDFPDPVEGLWPVK